MKMKGNMIRRFIRPVGRAVAASTLAAGVVAASALPAAASFTTPKYRMTCDTGYYGSFANYRGWGRCYAPGVAKWKIRLNCSWGGTYDSYWVVTGPDQWYTLTSPHTCYWGVNSVTVHES